MTFNKHLVEAANSRGFIVREITNGVPTKFGESNVVKIENGQFKVTFTTNVLNGTNYCHVDHVEDYLLNKHYWNSRYHFKFISTVSVINGLTHIAMKEVSK